MCILWQLEKQKTQNTARAFPTESWKCLGAQGGLWGVGRPRQGGPVWSLDWSLSPRSPALTLGGAMRKRSTGEHFYCLFFSAWLQGHLIWEEHGERCNCLIRLREGVGLTIGNVEVTSYPTQWNPGRCLHSRQWTSKESFITCWALA